MRRLAVAAALLASSGCGETRGDVRGTGISDPSGNGGHDGGTVVLADAASEAAAAVEASICREVTLVRETAEGGPSCSFRVPLASEFGVSAYNALTLHVSYVDTSGPRYVLGLKVVRDETDCGNVDGAYYFLPRYTPEHVVLCPSACALHFEAEAGSTVGGTIVAAYGCPG